MCQRKAFVVFSAYLCEINSCTNAEPLRSCTDHAIGRQRVVEKVILLYVFVDDISRHKNSRTSSKGAGKWWLLELKALYGSRPGWKMHIMTGNISHTVVLNEYSTVLSSRPFNAGYDKGGTVWLIRFLN